jgi:hypothetical protein
MVRVLLPGFRHASISFIQAAALAFRVRGRPNGCGFLLRLYFFLSALTASAAPLTLQISNEAAPPGGSAQIKVWASAPTLIASGGLSIDFDPSVFGPIAQLAVFSATGDQIGYANERRAPGPALFFFLGRHWSVAAIAVFTVSVPVLATAKPGATSSIAANPSALPKGFPLGVPWTDRSSLHGNRHHNPHRSLFAQRRARRSHDYQRHPHRDCYAANRHLDPRMLLFFNPGPGLSGGPPENMTVTRQRLAGSIDCLPFHEFRRRLAQSLSA